MLAALAGLLAATGYGTANFAGGMASRRQHASITLLLSQTTALLIVAVAAAGSGVGPGALGLDSLGLGAVGGLLGFTGAASAYLCYSLGRPIGVGAVLLGTTSAAVPTVAGLLAGTGTSPLAIAGLIAAAASLTVLGWPDQATTDLKAAALAATAGLMFGTYHTLMSHTPASTGLWPLVASQTVIATLGLIATLAYRRRPQHPHGTALSIGDGLASAAATIAALAAVRGGNLPAAGTLIALSPAITTLLARLFTQERLQPHRAAGLALALTAIACLTH